MSEKESVSICLRKGNHFVRIAPPLVPLSSFDIGSDINGGDGIQFEQGKTSFAISETDMTQLVKIWLKWTEPQTYGELTVHEYPLDIDEE